MAKQKKNAQKGKPISPSLNLEYVSLEKQADEVQRLQKQIDAATDSIARLKTTLKETRENREEIAGRLRVAIRNLHQVKVDMTVKQKQETKPEAKPEAKLPPLTE